MDFDIASNPTPFFSLGLFGCDWARVSFIDAVARGIVHRSSGCDWARVSFIDAMARGIVHRSSECDWARGKAEAIRAARAFCASATVKDHGAMRRCRGEVVGAAGLPSAGPAPLQR